MAPRTPGERAAVLVGIILVALAAAIAALIVTAVLVEDAANAWQGGSGLTHEPGPQRTLDTITPPAVTS